MAILTPPGGNLQFQTPDLQTGASNLNAGLLMLAGMAKDHRLDKERDAFNAAIAGGEEAQIEAEIAELDAEIAKLGGGNGSNI